MPRATCALRSGAGRYLKRQPFGANFDAVKRRAETLAPTAVAR